MRSSDVFTVAGFHRYKSVVPLKPAGPGGAGAGASDVSTDISLKHKDLFVYIRIRGLSCRKGCLEQNRDITRLKKSGLSEKCSPGEVQWIPFAAG